MKANKLSKWPNTKRMKLLEPGEEYGGYRIIECLDGFMPGRAMYQIACGNCEREFQASYVTMREREKLGRTKCRYCGNHNAEKSGRRKIVQEHQQPVVYDATGYPWMRLSRMGFRNAVQIARDKR